MGGKILKVFDDKFDCGGYDFFGIKIFVEVVCSSGMSSEIIFVVDC